MARILVVDDSEEWRALTEAVLTGAGCGDVRCVASAAEAFAQLGIADRRDGRSTMADLVILDVVMPGIDGIEACAQIRSHPAHADVPIIMVTAVDDIERLAGAFGAGATDYLTKPFKSVELLARTRSALRIKAELDRRRARANELLARMMHVAEPSGRRWIDPVTGLFVGEAAEAYLDAAPAFIGDDVVTVVALAVDRLDTIRVVHGEAASRAVLARVADEVRKAACAVGTITASYWDGLIVLVAPRLAGGPARRFAERLCAAVSGLAISAREAIAVDAITVSAGLLTARGRGVDAQLVAGARAIARGAVAGGNRVIAVDLSSS